VSRVVFPSGHQAWLVTRYRDVQTVLSDPRFSRYLLYPGAPCIIEPGDFSTGERSILNLDPPDHTRLRRLTAQAFNVRRIEGLRPRIQQITDELLTAMIDRMPPVDLVEEFAPARRTCAHWCPANATGRATTCSARWCRRATTTG
jgi:cytochrome P450